MKELILNELKSYQLKDPKEFWYILKNGTGRGKKGDFDTLTSENFYDHFVKLNEDLADQEENDLTDVSESQDEFNNVDLNNSNLNSPFTIEELKKGIKSLKNGKASGHDKIVNEMLKSSNDMMISAYVKLFNIILDTGHIPDNWTIGIIKPIFKNKGSKNDTDNYRGITLLSCLGKLFTATLNTRLTNFLEDNMLLLENQAGFRSEYSTNDHMITLKSIIDLYLSSGRRLFCAFVDYLKAFDTVNRTALWKKLLSYKISGKIFRAITNLYKATKSCISHKGKTSSFFYSNVGVRQGENLSPLLFAIFLNDMEDFFRQRNGGTSLKLIEKLDKDSRNGEFDTFLKLFVLMYADDTILLADNEIDMQKLLDSLHAFCEHNKLQVNTDKTKVMVFTRSKVRLKNLTTFKMGGTNLERVEEYNYLGMLFTWNGKFTKAKAKLAVKATRAMYSVIQNGRRLNLPVGMLLKLFDSCVAPILLYGAETWGFDKMDVIENVHTRFCKIITKKVNIAIIPLFMVN